MTFDTYWQKTLNKKKQKYQIIGSDWKTIEKLHGENRDK